MVSKVSVLIPVYNQEVGPLVEALLKEAATLSLLLEVRVYDDGSRPEFLLQNRQLKNITGVVYQELSENIGRSRIRYLLAQEAIYNHLLFLDNDVLPVHQNFLARYLQAGPAAVTVGGVAYQSPCPPGLELRWKYGKAREEAPAKIRQQERYQRIFSSNLFLEKSVFLEHFPQNELSGYGHEDTLFAWRLQQKEVEVLHVENPVWHLGLEPPEIFLLKTQQALHNLVLLQKRYQVGQETKLFKTYLQVKRWKGLKVLQESSSWLLPLLQKNLTSRKPNLKFFDLYRLLLLCKYLGKG